MHNKCLWFPPAACLAHPRLTDRLLWPLDLPSTQSDLRFLIYNSFLTGDRQGRNIGHASQVLSGVVPVRLQGALTAGISLVHRAGRWGWSQGTVASWRLRAHGGTVPSPPEAREGHSSLHTFNWSFAQGPRTRVSWTRGWLVLLGSADRPLACPHARVLPLGPRARGSLPGQPRA